MPQLSGSILHIRRNFDYETFFEAKHTVLFERFLHEALKGFEFVLIFETFSLGSASHLLCPYN